MEGRKSQGEVWKEKAAKFPGVSQIMLDPGRQLFWRAPCCALAPVWETWPVDPGEFFRQSQLNFRLVQCVLKWSFLEVLLTMWVTDTKPQYDIGREGVPKSHLMLKTVLQNYSWVHFWNGKSWMSQANRQDRTLEWNGKSQVLLSYPLDFCGRQTVRSGGN